MHEGTAGAGERRGGEGVAAAAAAAAASCRKKIRRQRSTFRAAHISRLSRSSNNSPGERADDDALRARFTLAIEPFVSILLSSLSLPLSLSRFPGFLFYFLFVSRGAAGSTSAFRAGEALLIRRSASANRPASISAEFFFSCDWTKIFRKISDREIPARNRPVPWSNVVERRSHGFVRRFVQRWLNRRLGRIISRMIDEIARGFVLLLLFSLSLSLSLSLSRLLSRDATKEPLLDGDERLLESA